MTWFATFQCLKCEHFWRELAPEDTWEMACKVATAAVCPLCGAKMREGEVELLSHGEEKIAILGSASYIPKPSSCKSTKDPQRR